MVDFNLLQTLDKESKNPTVERNKFEHVELEISGECVELLIPKDNIFIFEKKITNLTNINIDVVRDIALEQKGVLLKGFKKQQIRIE